MAPINQQSGSVNRQKIELRGRPLKLATPVIMGILNATPDSFSDGGLYNAVEDALGRIESMVRQGATIIDIGGESTRPGAEPVPAEQERERVMPILKKALERYPDHYFSVDTRTCEVAREALECGAHMINDVSGLKDLRLAELCAEHKAGYVLMHSQGDPEQMQEDPRYDEVVADIKSFFEKKLEEAAKIGLQEVMIDPGIGFGKLLNHNLQLLARLDAFLDFGKPIMIGASRKSMFDEILEGRSAEKRITATVSAHYEAMIRGARILRVHDVQEASDSIKVFNALRSVRDA